MTKHRRLTEEELDEAHRMRKKYIGPFYKMMKAKTGKYYHKRIRQKPEVSWEFYCFHRFGLTRTAVERQLTKAGYVAPRTKLSQRKSRLRLKKYGTLERTRQEAYDTYFRYIE